MNKKILLTIIVASFMQTASILAAQPIGLLTQTAKKSTVNPIGRFLQNYARYKENIKLIDKISEHNKNKLNNRTDKKYDYLKFYKSASNKDTNYFIDLINRRSYLGENKNNLKSNNFFNPILHKFIENGTQSYGYNQSKQIINFANKQFDLSNSAIKEGLCLRNDIATFNNSLDKQIKELFKGNNKQIIS